MKRKQPLMVVLAMVAILAAACGQSSKTAEGQRQGAPAPGAQAGAPKKGGTIVILGHQEVASLSPQDDGPSVQRAVIEEIHNALLEINHNYELENVLAESYEVSKDGLTYTFKLRKGVKFHDGTEFTAEDVKYTYEFYGDPKNATVIRTRFQSVSKVEAVDPYTVRVTLKEPDATFLRLAATTFIVPKQYHSQVGENTYKTKPIGTGPFKLKEWKPAEYTLLEAFPEHFRGRPNVDFFRLNVVPEPSVRAIALQTGEADSTVWPLTTEDNLRFAKEGKFKVYRTPSVAVNHFPLNNRLPQFQDKRVRQAMMYAIDRQRLIDDIYKGAAVLATGNLAPALKEFYEPDVPKYPYDQAKAKALLEEAGWKVGTDGIREKAGQKLKFTITVISGDQVRKPAAEFVQQALKQVGFQVEIREAPVATILEKLPKGEMDASIFNWTYGGTGGEPDASSTLLTGAARNFSGYSNPKVDELIKAGKRETDPAKRRQIYRDIQKIVAEDVPFLYIAYWDWFNIFSPRIKGLPESAQNGDMLYRTAYKWWIDK